MSSIKVLVVDDHSLFRMGLQRLLSDVPGIKIIGEALNGEDAIRIVREKEPNVVLMDVLMPGIGGLEATRKILRASSDTKVLAVTMCDDDLFPSRLLQAGASGYLTKDSSHQEMVQAIRSVHCGQLYISPKIANMLAMKHLNDSSDKPFDKLSERELQVTIMITQGMRVAEIAEALHLSPKTVNSYRYRIFEKLRVENDVELTHLAMRYNLIQSNSSVETGSE